MSNPSNRTQNRPAPARARARPTEPRRPGEPSDYPRGYIEQLAARSPARAPAQPCHAPAAALKHERR